MMYPYMILFDETEVTHSHIIEEDICNVEVHFERPTEEGFDTLDVFYQHIHGLNAKGHR